MTDTNQVRLRAVERHDLAFTRKCRNNPRVHLPALGRRFPITEVGEEDWFSSLGQGPTPAEVTYIVARVTDEVAIGLTTLRQIDWINRTAMFGVWIAPDAQHNGLGKAATAEMLAVAFGRLNLRKVALEVLASNERAVALYRSLGFVEEGRFVDQMFIDGKYEDVIRMAVVAP
jgi:diamine N-acetyltransferase